MRLPGITYQILFAVLLFLYMAITFWSWHSFHFNLVHENQNDKLIQEHFHSSKQKLEALSSVDYYACCGLGHRLVRMSLAAYVAKQRNFSIRAFWGWCGERNPIEVFSYLFRPYLDSEVLPNVKSENMLLPFYNEVPGFAALERKPTTNLTECACQSDKIDSDLEFYTSLRTRFRNKKFVDAFVKDNFSNSMVIGIHVRAGNGEGGDFERKGRVIENPEEWVGSVCKLVHDFSTENKLPLPPTVYIATDTPSMISSFKAQLNQYNIRLLDLPQERTGEGEGVLFGDAANVNNKGDKSDDYSTCLKGWTDTLTDMFLLSHADVVIASKPSSFSQTVPMSIAFGKKEAERKIDTPFCEIIPQMESHIEDSKVVWKEISHKLQCYNSYMDWCCNYSTWIRFKKKGPKNHVKVVSKEFVRFPPPNNVGKLKEYPGMRNRTKGCLRPGRGRAAGGRKDKCLPHAW